MTEYDFGLTKRFHEVLCHPCVGFVLDRNLFGGGQALIHITIPGKTPRAKRIEPLPVIVGEPGESHADMLRRLANSMDQAGRPNPPPPPVRDPHLSQ